MNATQEIRRGIEVICINRVHINADFTMKPGGVGRFVASTNQTATVEYEVPKRPSKCERCGKYSELSMNGGTREVECLAIGCGHNHGFETVSVKVPLSSLKKKG